jgi:hypothetical protein
LAVADCAAYWLSTAGDYPNKRRLRFCFLVVITKEKLAKKTEDLQADGVIKDIRAGFA